MKKIIRTSLFGFVVLVLGSVSALTVSIAFAASIPTGTISGHVSIEQLKQDSTKTQMGAAVVYVTGFDEPAPSTLLTVFQKDKTFKPTVIAITRGQKISFENNDPIMHNVFSNSQAQAFDLGMAQKDETSTIQFRKTGILNVYCNIHPEMISTILVLPNRAFDIVKPDGSYRIQNVPQGARTIRIWHRLADPKNQNIEVKAGKDHTLDWNIALTRSIQPHLNKNDRPYKKNKTIY